MAKTYTDQSGIEDFDSELLSLSPSEKRIIEMQQEREQEENEETQRDIYARVEKWRESPRFESVGCDEMVDSLMSDLMGY